MGVSEPFLKTVKIDDLSRFLDAAFVAAPAIYQEFIGGTQHLRLLCFGDRSLSGVINTAEVDWRPNLNVQIDSWDLPTSLHRMIRRTLDALGLEMGVVDVKIDHHGEFVWLEVNPQGQFIFLEPMTGINFIDEFARYLLEQADSVLLPAK